MEIFFNIFILVVKELCMGSEDDINTAHYMKSICRAALLNDNSPDLELYRTRVRVTGEKGFLTSTFTFDEPLPPGTLNSCCAPYLCRPQCAYIALSLHTFTYYFKFKLNMQCFILQCSQYNDFDI